MSDFWGSIKGALLIALALHVLPALSWAAPVEVVGQVVDTERQPVPHARVTLRAWDHAPLAAGQAVEGATGKFRIALGRAPRGVIWCEVAAEGFEDRRLLLEQQGTAFQAGRIQLRRLVWMDEPAVLHSGDGKRIFLDVFVHSRAPISVIGLRLQGSVAHSDTCLNAEPQVTFSFSDTFVVERGQPISAVGPVTAGAAANQITIRGVLHYDPCASGLFLLQAAYPLIFEPGGGQAQRLRVSLPASLLLQQDRTGPTRQFLLAPPQGDGASSQTLAVELLLKSGGVIRSPLAAISATTSTSATATKK